MAKDEIPQMPTSKDWFIPEYFLDKDHYIGTDRSVNPAMSRALIGVHMIVGMSTSAFTTLHVLISLLAIATGLCVFLAMLADRWLTLLNEVFLYATVATSATGFLFDSKSFGPPHVIGVISLLVLVVAAFALYRKRLAARWLKIYVVSALTALYLNVFVGVVQAFQKIPGLHALAPTQSEAPFLIAQSVVLASFISWGVFAVIRAQPVSRPTGLFTYS